MEESKSNVHVAMDIWGTFLIRTMVRREQASATVSTTLPFSTSCTRHQLAPKKEERWSCRHHRHEIMAVGRLDPAWGKGVRNP